VRKRCDFWELHLPAGEDVLIIDTGEQKHRFVLQSNDIGVVEVQPSEQQLYPLLRSLPEPKGLVIVLLSYDQQTRLGIVDNVPTVVQRVLERLRLDAAGRIRYEFLNIGIAEE